MDIAYNIPPSVVEAVLTEDFIDTVRAVKGPYLRARLTGYLSPNDNAKCPLVHVDSPYTMLPMKAGDAILVEIPGESPGSLRLWGIDAELPEALRAELAMPSSGTIVTAPQAYDVFSFQYFSPGFYILSGDEITTVVSGGVQTIYTPKSVLVFCASDGEYSIKSQSFNLETQASARFLSNGMSLKSRNIELKAILENIYAQLSDLYSAIGTYNTHTHTVATAGTAVAQTGTAAPTTSVIDVVTPAAALATEKAQTVAEFFRLS